MAATHTFTRNDYGTAIDIVLSKIAYYERDELSECTVITLEGDKKIGVSETVEEVRTILNAKGS